MKCEERRRSDRRKSGPCTTPVEDKAWVRKQINQDTCEAHGVFCCDECFDMTTSEDE